MERALEVDPDPTWWKRHLQVPSGACEAQCRNNGEETPFQMGKDDFPILYSACFGTLASEYLNFVHIFTHAHGIFRAFLSNSSLISLY